MLINRSQYSVQEIKDKEILNQYDENAITDVKITESDTYKTCDHLKENSALGPDGIPVYY